MGFLDGIKGEVQQQFIARPDSAKASVYYKWPETNIRMMSVITVQPDERAFFVKKGQVVGVIEPGQTKLDGAQVPFLGGFIDEWTGSNVLMAEIYFVSTKDFPNNKFGASMSDVKDPYTGVMVKCGVFGEYVFRVVDAPKFILNLVGTSGANASDDNAFVQDSVKDFLTKNMRTIVNGTLGEKQWPLLDITGGVHAVDFEVAVLTVLNQNLASWGLAVPALEDFVVSVNDEDRNKMQEIYDRKAKMDLARDPAYLAMAQAEAILGAGEGMKQGGDGTAMAGMFIGAGIGAGLGQPVAGAAGAQAPAQAAAVASAPAATPVAAVPCPACSAANPAGTKFCGECGGKMVAEPAKCTNCGAVLAAGLKFCGECGTKAGG